MEQKYTEAHPGPHQPIDFESDQIKLDIPVGGVSLQGWRIIPLTAPVVSVCHSVYCMDNQTQLPLLHIVSTAAMILVTCVYCMVYLNFR